MILIILLSILLIIMYLATCEKEKFISCGKIPSGPYKTKCTDIKFNDNILQAFCPKQEPENTFEISRLDLTDCVRDLNDCDSININSQGKLVCE